MKCHGRLPGIRPGPPSHLRNRHRAWQPPASLHSACPAPPACPGSRAGFARALPPQAPCSPTPERRYWRRWRGAGNRRPLSRCERAPPPPPPPLCRLHSHHRQAGITCSMLIDVPVSPSGPAAGAGAAGRQASTAARAAGPVDRRPAAVQRAGGGRRRRSSSGSRAAGLGADPPGAAAAAGPAAGAAAGAGAPAGGAAAARYRLRHVEPGGAAGRTGGARLPGGRRRLPAPRRAVGGRRGRRLP